MKTAMANTPGPPRTPLTSLSSLTHQSSIYTLTLEELQHAVNDPGKSFGSMNMEEFLKNIWTVEESQAMAAAMSGVIEGNGSSLTGNTPYPPAGLQRQSSMSLPMNLTGKTVDEVWKEIHRSSDHSAADNIQQRQMTMADITLEDFLAKAGVVREEVEVEPSNNSSAVTLSAGLVSSGQANIMQASQVTPQQVDWLSFQLKSTMPHQQLLQHQHQQLLQQHQHQQQQQAEAAAASFSGRLVAPAAVGLPPATAANVLDTPYDASAALGTGSLSHSSALAVSDRKRPFEVYEEKSIEQRQKRMIKNRESAARSRARKQAYTVELESEVTQLKEENAKLLQQQVEVRERRRKQLMETLVPVTTHPQRSRRALRRTQTTSW